MPNNLDKPILVSIVGPTAVGKTDMALELAEEFGTEIISADSRQFYRELEIGTAKPTPDELSRVRHHFINSHSIEESYNAGQYGRDAQQCLVELFREHKIVLAVGGSGLYLKALWEGFDEIPEVDVAIREELNEHFRQNGLKILLEELKEADPEYYSSVDKNNGQRVIRALEVIRGTGQTFTSFRKLRISEQPYENLKIGLDMDREVLFHRINERMDAMIRGGLFEEAEKYVSHRNHNALQTVGYTEIFGYLDGTYDKEETIRLLKRNSRRYAKRQMTWFRRYDDIHWYTIDQKKDIVAFVKKLLEGRAKS
ncbi:MAG: tRNA (adenosine(37)-N6)-dimethylallyltransferase MiaA [Cyclobacteriaceae bacterium]